MARPGSFVDIRCPARKRPRYAETTGLGLNALLGTTGSFAWSPQVKTAWTTKVPDDGRIVASCLASDAIAPVVVLGVGGGQRFSRGLRA
jgi:hypothetical protein